MNTGGGLRHRGTPSSTEPGAKSFGSDQPGPVEIVLAREEHKFELNTEALEAVLLSEDVRDKPVVVVSVAGAFRKGKSFLLDFLLRYLQNQGFSDSDWMGGDTDPLTGFSWRGGVDRHTTGILMWSKAFPITLPRGQEVAVLLFDTQGAFDNQSTVKDCATIFALSTMISSVEVYNLSMIIQETDLQHLHLFTEYGRLALKESKEKPFQSMWFLVRDWSYPYDHEFGENGGSEYLEKVLKISDGQHDEIKVVRKHIHSCFDGLSCFLMPHPGLKVATNPSFDGRLADIDSEFKTYLQQLVPLLLEPSRLIIKRINGNIVTGRGLVECFKAYMKIFESDELPEPKSMLRATAEANNLAALATAFDRYNREMEEICGPETPYLAPDKLEEHHKMIRSICVDQFINTPKMGGEEFSTSFLEKLESQIDESYDSIVKRNASKHILNAYRTPAVLGCIMVTAYILSYILEIVGIQSLTQTAVLGLYVPMLFLLVWMYIRYSGQLREIGQFIDNLCEALWEQFLQPVYAKLLEKGLQQAVKMSTGGTSGNKKTD